MLPGLLALFLRSLRDFARSRMLGIAGCAVVGVVLVLLFINHIASLGGGAPGLLFLAEVMFLNTALITLAGSYFASAITEEKEEGTLPLLKMTGMSSLAILLGKSTSRLFATVLLLMVQLPFTLLAATLGGVSPRQILAAYLALGAYTVLLCNLALLASVWARRTSSATVFVMTLLVLHPTLALLLKSVPGFFTGGSTIPEIAVWLPRLAGVGEALGTLSPFHRMAEIFATGFRGDVAGSQVWLSICAAGSCFLVAWITFGRFSERVGKGSGRIVPLPTSWLKSFAPPRTTYVRAVEWKDFHFLYGGLWLTRVKWVLYGLIPVVFLLATADLGESATGTVFLTSLLVACEALIASSRAFRTEVRQRTLVGLAVLPLTMRAVYVEKVEACWQMLRPGMTWLGISLMGSFCIAILDRGESMVIRTAGGFLLVVYLTTQTWFAGHLVAWLSLRLPFGALPLGLAVVFVLNFIGTIICGIGLVALPMIALVLSTQIRDGIQRRLEWIAAEG